MDQLWEATFFDGKTASSQDVAIFFSDLGIVFTDHSDEDYFWPYKTVRVEHLEHEARVTSKKSPDATLLLPRAALTALTQQVPYLEEGARRRRGFVGLIVGLVAAAVATATFVFVVLPSSAAYLAQRTPVETERQVGENLASQVQLFFRPCKNDEAHDLLRPIVQEFAKAASIEYDVTLTLVRTPMPNAFALPGGQMMATQGFLRAVGNDQEAFWGVIAHELAHVKNRDGMVALYRNLGLSTLLEIVTGGSGLAQQAVLVGGQLTNLSYTRGQEQAADELAYEIMRRRSLNPAALGRALSALTAAIQSKSGIDSSKPKHESDMPEWLQTHPDTERRIKRAMELESNGSGQLPLSQEEWDIVQSACEA